MEHTLIHDAASTRATPRALLRRWEWAALAAIALLAFGLRVWAVRWSLPYVDHLDEPNPVDYALRMLSTGDLNQHVFRKPSLFVYLLAAVYAIHYRWGLAAGLYTTSLDQMVIHTHRYTTVPEFFVWGRMLTIAFATATVWGVYLLGKRTWSRSAGLIAALFVATSPFHLRHSQFITFDVPSAAIVLFAYLAAWRIAERGQWRSYLLAGLITGFAASTKYNAGAVATVVVAAHVLYWGRQSLARFGRLIASGGMAVVGFVLGTPYAVLAWREFLAGVVQQQRDYDAGSHGDAVGAWNFGAYGDFLWHNGLGQILCLATVLGLIILLRSRRRKAGLLWLSFAVPYLLALAAQSTHFMRNLMPLLVLCALPIGVAGAALIEWLSQRAPRLRPALAIAVLLALFALPARAALQTTIYEARTNTKLLAEQYARTLPRGQRIGVELNALQFPDDQMIEVVKSVTDHPVEWYRANNYRYLITNDSRRDSSASSVAAYDALKAAATVIDVFPGEKGGQPGPRIEVLDLGVDPAALKIVHRPAQFGPALRLLGYEVQPGPVRPSLTSLNGADERVIKPGDGLELNLTWQALAHLPVDYTLFVHVLDGDGNKVAQRDLLMRPNDYPTSRWQPNEIVLDVADVPLPTLARGTYRVLIGVYRMDAGERLPLAQPEPGSDGSSLTLMTLDVR